MTRRPAPLFVIAPLVILLSVVATPATADESSPAPTASPTETLQQALDGRFNIDLVQRVHLTTRSETGGSTERVVEMALKQIDGKLRAIADIVEPEHLRGTRVLSIEVPGRDDDQFMYMPAFRRVRRISGAQRADLFLGTDVTLEDFERRYAVDYEVSFEGETPLRDEDVTMIAARPKFDTNYDVALFFIAPDHMISEIRYFTDGTTAPQRIVRAYRPATPWVAGLGLPGRLVIENHKRGTTTSVDFEIVRVDADLPDSFFSRDFLESSRSIPLARATE